MVAPLARPLVSEWTDADDAAFDARATILEAKAERQVYWEMGRVVARALPETTDRRAVTLDGLTEALASGALAGAVIAALLIGGDLGYDYGSARLRTQGVTPPNFPAVNPLLAEWAQQHTGEAIAGIDSETARRLRLEYRDWLEKGGSIEQLVRTLRSINGVFGRYRARLISINETTTAHYWAARQTYLLSGQVIGMEIRTSMDDRVCPRCAPLEGKRVISPLDNVGWIHPGGSGEEAKYAGEIYTGLPIHVGCILPGNKVVLPGVLEAATKSLYDGLAIEITLASGRRITVTPNHPILARHGWSAAQMLRPGNDVLRTLDGQRIAFMINPDNEHVPTVIEQVFRTLKMANIMSSCRVPVSPMDFYGDGRNIHGDVEIIGSDRLLKSKGQPRGSQPSAQHCLRAGRETNGLPRLRHAYAFSASRPAPSRRLVCSEYLRLANFERHTTPFDGFSLGLSPGSDPTALQPETESSPTDTGFTRQDIFRFAGDITGEKTIQIRNSERSHTALRFINARGTQYTFNGFDIHPPFPGEFCRRFASLIAVDKIVQVRDFLFRGHVYDLQVAPHAMYFTNGIITHNCRCRVVPVLA